MRIDGGNLALLAVGAIAIWGALGPQVPNVLHVDHAGARVIGLNERVPARVVIPLEDRRFQILAQINGVGIQLTVDTGAMIDVVLAPGDAALLESGVVSEGEVRVTDVAGFVRVMSRVRIAQVEIGEIMFTDVSAVIMSTGTTSLIGLPLLEKLARFEYRGGELVLEQ